MRIATLEDMTSIGETMRDSMRELGAAYYDPQQLASAVKYIAVPDPQIISDGTYFVIDDERGVAACGGWSKRGKLFAGPNAAAGDERMLDPATDPARVRAMFVRPDAARRGLGSAILEACEDAARTSGFRVTELMATLPGVPLYARCGYHEVEQVIVTLPDGVTLPCIRMEKDL